MKATLRSTESKMVNIPSKVWKEAGWKLNDEVYVGVCENLGTMEKWNSISIDRIKDEHFFNEVEGEGEENTDRIALYVTYNLDSGEGMEVEFARAFEDETSLFRLDVLKDAIGMLENEYEKVHEEWTNELQTGYKETVNKLINSA